MKHILLLGAGRSSTSLIEFLLESCRRQGWMLTVGDLSEPMAQVKTGSHPNGRGIAFDIHNEAQRELEIEKADLVISLLPLLFHGIAARSCIKFKKSLLTASYVSPEIRDLDMDAQKQGLLFLMECGLDPGLDHISAMQVIETIRNQGHKLIGFETFTGGLLAPSDMDNPWEYKFTWNPRNVVLAGSGGAKFIQEGTYKYIPYHRLFRRTEIIHIPGFGYFEGYGNRDSLSYLDAYGLRGIKTLYRGTLRRVGFCKAWDTFVQLGATDDSYEMESVGSMTHRDFINSFLLYDPHNTVELKLAYYMQFDLEGEEMYKLRRLGIFDKTPVGLSKGTPAQILEHILKKSWTIGSDERDMIVMWHKFDYLDSETSAHRRLNSYLVVEGDDSIRTAMAKTVGIPLGIAAEQFLLGKIQAAGVQIPTIPEIYNPILAKLPEYGIVFHEREANL